jgi:hypothetical protein
MVDASERRNAMRTVRTGYHQIFGCVIKGMLLTIARRDSQERCHRLARLPAQFNNLVFLPPAVGFEAFMMGTP